MNIAIITARGGSKRIPKKNIRIFQGKPMIAWPIRVALESGLFEHVLVSTDEEEIAAVAREYGAETPFLRPPELADDYVDAHVAAKHALLWALENWGPIDAFCHIYPTAPMLTPQQLQAGLACLNGGILRSLFVTKLANPIYNVILKHPQRAPYRGFSSKEFQMRSQDMPDAFFDTGTAYWFTVPYYLSQEPRIDEHTKLIPVDPRFAVDIDTEDDWVSAEQLFAAFTQYSEETSS